jgi:hypothetical protein
MRQVFMVANIKTLRSYEGPCLGILRLWAQENFAPPPLFVRIHLCVSKKRHKKLTKDKTVFSV